MEGRKKEDNPLYQLSWEWLRVFVSVCVMLIYAKLLAENAALEKDVEYLKEKLAYVEVENNTLLDQLSELITNNPVSFSITRELLQAFEETTYAKQQ